MTEVKVHPHLTRYRAGVPDMISVTELPNGNAEYVERVVLKNARFYVSQEGRQRVIRNGQRNVHAWAIGELADDSEVPIDGWRQTYYNPYENITFVDAETGEAVGEVSFIKMEGIKCYYA